MTIKEIYEYASKIGVLIFSTIHNNEVHSRAAHFNGYDEEGIYFRTMITKPFYRQLKATGKVTVCGISDARILRYEDDGTPVFPTSYTFRLIGEIKNLAPEIIIEKAKTNQALKTAANDILKYPSMREGNFVIHKAKVDIFDVDFEREKRDDKMIRTRASFGGMEYNISGVSITDACIECGKCKSVCSFNAISEGSPYKVDSSRCEDCGSCIFVCPVKAINESLVF